MNQTSNISHNLVGNKIGDHSDAVERLPVGAAPSYIFSLDLEAGFKLISKIKCKTRRETFKFWHLGALYQKFDGIPTVEELVTNCDISKL